MPSGNGTAQNIFASVAGGPEPDHMVCDCFMASQDADHNKQQSEREGSMAVRWTAHIPMAMQQHGGGAKIAHAERPVQPATTSPESKADRAPPLPEAVDAR
jgi:hypothetical protein